MSFRNFDTHYIEEMSRRKETSISLMKHFMIDLSFFATPILSEHPEYDQYTFFIYKPYFNDGDECEYELRSIDYNDSIRKKDQTDLEYEAEYEAEYGDKEPDYYYSAYVRNKEHYLYEIFNTITYYLPQLEKVVGDIKIYYTHKDGFSYETFNDHE